MDIETQNEYYIPPLLGNLTILDKTINSLNWILGYQQIKNMLVGTMLSVGSQYDFNGNKTIEWFIRKDIDNCYTHITYANKLTKETTYSYDFYK